MRHVVFLTLGCALLGASPLMAQAPASPAAAPPPPVTGNVSAGLALTSGNKDTSTVNAAYEFKYDPKTMNVFTSSGLALVGSSDGEKTAEQWGLKFRDEYALNARASVYGDFRYFHDKFKGVDYLLSPTGGLGYKLVDRPATALSASAGLGVVWEKDYGFDLQTKGAVTFDEKLTQKISGTVSAGQTFSALWKTYDFGDALYAFGATLTASVVGHLQLKVELIDTYKNKPPDPTLKKNDVTFVVGIVYKF